LYNIVYVILRIKAFIYATTSRILTWRNWSWTSRYYADVCTLANIFFLLRITKLSLHALAKLAHRSSIFISATVFAIAYAFQFILIFQGFKAIKLSRRALSRIEPKISAAFIPTLYISTLWPLCTAERLSILF